MIATFDGVTYRYPGAHEPALSVPRLEVDPGAFALVAGPSAGGKSTLLRLFNGLIPQFHGGTLGGRCTVAGADPARTPTREMARRVGMVFQEPEAQAIADTVVEELAFGMEQHGIPGETMRARVHQLAGRLGIGHLLGRRVATLSGGERQRVAIAAVLALAPPLIVLDEPTSQLDPAGAADVALMLDELRARGDLAVVLAEHRLERFLPRATTVLSVTAGAARQLCPVAAAGTLEGVPPVVALGRRLGWRPLPLTPAAAGLVAPGLPVRPPAPGPAPGPVVLSVAQASVRYGQVAALDGVDLDLRAGEVVALTGANGSGKTTLFRAIAGLSGAGPRISFRGQAAPGSPQARTAFAGLVPQDPAMALYRVTVRAEIAESLRHRAHSRDVDAVMARWEIADLAARNPRDLSAGQQQRVAIAAMLAHEPPVWLLDEPTRGADAAFKAWLAARLRDHASAGGAVIVATHDIESAATCATRAVGLESGRIAFDLPRAVAFGHGGPLQTQVADLVPSAITIDDVEETS
jgi:energy-coupling factor transport system ATP-binding protein